MPGHGASPDICEGELELWREYKATGSVEAHRKLFDLYSDFARHVARKHFLDRKSGDIEFSELCQLAYTGLLEALERYDPARGIPFKPYSRRRISGSIVDGISHMSEVREQISFRQRALRERLKSFKLDDPEKLGAAEAMQALIEMVTGLALGFMLEGNGLYIAPDEGDTRLSPYDSLAWREMTQALSAEIIRLPGQEGKVIRYHYLEGLSFEQIAATLGLTRSRVSQIHKSALRHLRDRLAPQAFSLEK